MSEWPDGWFRESPGASPDAGKSPAAGGAAAAGSEGPAGPPSADDTIPPGETVPAASDDSGLSAAAGAFPLAGAAPGAAPPAGSDAPLAGGAPAFARAEPTAADAGPTVAAAGPIAAGAGPALEAGAGTPPWGGGNWPTQPPVSTKGRSGGTGGGWRPRLRRWLRPRRVLTVLAVFIALLLIATVSMYFLINSKITRQNVLVDYPGRPVASAGTNWLITGSDSRQGLTRKEERKLSTGFDVSGHRSDTILVLHVPSNGLPPVLISLPRDSYVPIPGHGYNKINAAYAFGGGRLLAETVQNITGLRIDHYMSIGFGGFVNVVNAIGGVQLCLVAPLHNRQAGLNLKKGCQNLDGQQALGYVRDRHSFATEDLQRVQDQRIFLKALLSKLTSTGVLLNPFSSIPAAIGCADALTVDNGTSLYQLVQVAFALRHPETTTVPIANANYVTSAGDAVQWNSAQAKLLFNALKNDKPVPPSLLTGSKQAT